MFFIIRCDAFFPSRVLKHVSIQLVEVEKKTTTQVRMRGACQESRAKKITHKNIPILVEVSERASQKKQNLSHFSSKRHLTHFLKYELVLKKKTQII